MDCFFFRYAIYIYRFLFLSILFKLVKKGVDKDTENKGASDRGDNHVTDLHRHTADTGDKDNGYGKEVRL